MGAQTGWGVIRQDDLVYGLLYHIRPQESLANKLDTVRGLRHQLLGPEATESSL